MSQHAAHLRTEALAALQVCMDLDLHGVQPELSAKLRATAQERIEAAVRTDAAAAAAAAAPDAARPNTEAHLAIARALQDFVTAGAPVLAADEPAAAPAAPAAPAAGRTMWWVSRKERVAWFKANALAEMCGDARVPRRALPASAPAPAPVKGQLVRPQRTKEERMAIHAAKMAHRGALVTQWGVQRHKDVDKEWQTQRRERRAERTRLQEIEHAERRAKRAAPTAAAVAAPAPAPTREEELRTAWGKAVARARHFELDVEHLQVVVKRLREELEDKEQTLQFYREALQARHDAERAEEEVVVVRGRRRTNSDGVEEEEFEIPPGIVRPPPPSQESVAIDTPERPAARAAPPALRFHRLRPRQVVPASGSEEEQVGYGQPEGALDRLLEGLEATPASPRPASEWLSTRAAPPERGPAAEPGRVEMVLVVAPKGIDRIQID